MKSYNHLWEKVISPDNILLAIINASKGKRKRSYVKRVYENRENYIEYFQKMAKTYKHHRKKPKTIYDGVSRKKRQIIVPTFDEQVLQHMIVNILQPIILKGKYYHVHGSLPNTGPTKAKKTIQKWIAHDTKNIKYFLKIDIRHFFGSIPHDKLEQLIKKKIHDERFINLLHEVIDCTEIGLPLGFHTSHWLANWYLQDLDHYIKEQLKVVHYIRYMDDMVIFGPNKRELHKIRESIEKFLNKKLNLEMKSNWAVARFNYVDKTKKEKGRDLDYMGYRFFRNRIIMRKSIMIKMTRKAIKIWKKDKPTIYDCKQIMSALGWLKQTNTYSMYLKHIKPYIVFRYLKKRISRYDKKQAKNKKEEILKCLGEIAKIVMV